MSFLGGALVGAIVLIASLIAYAGARQEKEKRLREKRAAEQSVNDLQSILSELRSMQQSSLTERLRRAMEITSRQSEIDLRAGGEQVLRYNELELEKLNLLKTILKEGHDPLITVRYATGDKRSLLSEYVASIQKTLH